MSYEETKGWRIRKALDEAKKREGISSDKEWAEKYDFNAATLSRWISNKYTCNPTSTARLADAMGVTVDWLENGETVEGKARKYTKEQLREMIADVREKLRIIEENL